ncbi:CDP-diacylglycerol--glycerol-3-phosphate 3-phosphatidyltransferase [Caviibacter abscessus]|uniref:CDP-diacylglycerol--glycerol-3-phosphate 3-phosphatidyltransferase n=1 Tax=Caviibacter abscessus TaxID=1766719 RepID=UPI0008369BCA|nr:CDP-diacylglycerol--glycerol-3-phosphate 3-phosphatidyltransferase [Caviibacter abscessus]
MLDFSKMNLPNKLTVLRLVLVIPFIVFFDMALSSRFIIFNYFGRTFALSIFLIAIATDYLDGKIARETGEVTDFGKIMDPIADKLLTFSCMFVLLKHNLISLIFVLIILTRELIVTAERAVAASRGAGAIPASQLGKYKTVATYIALSIAIILPNFLFFKFVNSLILVPAVFLTVISGIEYHNQAKKYFDSEL